MRKLRSSDAVGALSPDEAAAYWFVRADSAGLSKDENEEFKRWLSDPQNSAAFKNLNAAWDLFDGCDRNLHIEAVRLSALQAQRERRFRWWMPTGAVVAAASVTAAFLQLPSTDMHKSSATSAQSGYPGETADTANAVSDVGTIPYSTRKGERRSFTLPDGSNITLNTDSAIAVAYTSERRAVWLKRGQALFEVARATNRPFVVEAAARHIIAVGTVFEVRLDSDKLKVLVVEGRVVVQPRDGVARAQSAPTATLTAGQELLAELGAPQRIQATDVSKELRWREGYVEFNNEPLGAAAREISRYTDRAVVAEGNAAELRVSGIFRTGDSERFAKNVTEILPVSVHAQPSGALQIVMTKAASR